MSDHKGLHGVRVILGINCLVSCTYQFIIVFVALRQNSVQRSRV